MAYRRAMSDPADTSDLPVKKLVVFDFDGTLTTADTFVAFMKYYHGAARWYAKMVPLAGTFLAYKLGRIDRHAVKDAVVGAAFGGEPWSAVEASAQAFAAEVIPGLMRPLGLVRLRERLGEADAGGPEVVICSASISPYLEAYLRPLGVGRIVACELEMDESGMCTGTLRGFNVWGENKMKALREAFPRARLYLCESYGDSEGDRALLDAANVPFWRPFRD